MNDELRRLSDGYFRYFADDTDKNFEFWNDVTNVVLKGGDLALSLVLRLVADAPNPSALSYVAAGPLEDLLTRHGPAVWGAIKEEARRNPKLGAALGQVWAEGRIDRKVDAELRKLFQRPVKRR